MDQAASDAGNKELVVDDELNNRVEFLLAVRKHAIEFLCLRNSSGEAVEDETRIMKERVSHMSCINELMMERS